MESRCSPTKAECGIIGTYTVALAGTLRPQYYEGAGGLSSSAVSCDPSLQCTPLLAPTTLLRGSLLQAEIRAGTRSRGAFELLANLSGNAAGPLDADLILECYEQKKSMLTAGVAAEVEDFANILKLMAQLALPTEQVRAIACHVLCGGFDLNSPLPRGPCAIRVLSKLSERGRKETQTLWRGVRGYATAVNPQLIHW